jgi:hypothetical protein
VTFKHYLIVTSVATIVCVFVCVFPKMAKFECFLGILVAKFLYIYNYL